MSTEKISTLIIEVDLQCEKCSKKIRQVLCKLQTKENIRKIDFDSKKNTVTISGPFDPDKLYKKLKCKACHTIKDIKIVKPEEKKPEEKKPEEKKPEVKKPEEKKPEEKKPEEKKPEEKKPQEKKPEDKKPEDKKGGEKEKPKVEGKTPAATPPPWSSTTTVNLQFNNMCGICYPWPCSDPAHWGLHQPPQQPQPQWPPCEGMVPAQGHGGHHQHPVPWGKWSPCGGPAYCGGCGSCRGMHGWPVVPPPPQQQQQPMCCPGPSACRGCNGCRIVHESKFSYEEYPSSACAIM